MVKRISQLFHSENSIRGASIILIITLALSNVLGLLRDHFLAAYIPTSQLDIYFAAFRIPDLIFNFLILGAISSVFIPIFCDYIAGKKLSEGWKVTNSLLNIAVAVMIGFAVLMFFLMPWAMQLVVPNFSPEKFDKTVLLSRILMLTPIFFAASYIISGVLNSFKRFLAYSIAPLIYNLSIIVGTLILGAKIGVLGVVYFVVIGSFLHLIVQLPSAVKMGYHYQFMFNWNNPSVKRIFKLMIPRTIGMGMSQIMLVVYTAIASALTAGSISAFNFANNIQTMPTVVFGTSFATAIFPTLTTAIAEKNYQKYAFYFNRSVRTIAYLLIPISVIFILLRAQIVRLVLGAGQFEWSDTKTTALTLGFFSVSLIAQGLIPLLTRAFFAHKDTKTPMYISIVTVIVSVILGYYLSQKMGVAGLALAFSIGSYLNALILYIAMKKLSGFSFDFSIVISVIKISVSAVVMGVVIWFLNHQLVKIVDMQTFLGVLEQTLISSISGAVVYLGLTYLFRCEEIQWAIFRKISGTVLAEEEIGKK